MTSSRLITLVVGAALLVACGSEDEGGSATPAPVDSTPVVTETLAPSTTTEPGGPVSTDGASTHAWYEPGDILPGLQPFIDLAVTDLAERLEAGEDDITVRAAVLVTWPDSSLGCPDPRMSYVQVLVDGSVIELEHESFFYRYHSGGQEGPFLCLHPLTEAPAVTNAGGGSGGET